MIVIYMAPFLFIEIIVEPPEPLGVEGLKAERPEKSKGEHPLIGDPLA